MKIGRRWFARRVAGPALGAVSHTRPLVRVAGLLAITVLWAGCGGPESEPTAGPDDLAAAQGGAASGATSPPPPPPPPPLAPSAVHLETDHAVSSPPPEGTSTRTGTTDDPTGSGRQEDAIGRPPDTGDQRVAPGHHTAAGKIPRGEPLRPVRWGIRPDPLPASRAFEVPGGIQFQTPLLHQDTQLIRPLAPSPFLAAYVLAKDEPWRIGLIDLRVGRFVGQFTIARDLRVRAVTPDPDGKRAAVITWDGVGASQLEIRDFATGTKLLDQPMGAWSTPNEDRLFDFAGPDRLVYAVMIARGVKYRVVDPGSGNLFCEFSAEGFAGATRRRCAFSPGGKYLAAGDNQAVYAWDLSTGDVVAEIALPGERRHALSSPSYASFTGIAFSADGSRLIATTGDFPQIMIYTWDCATGELSSAVACALAKSVKMSLWNVPLQQVPGTDFWVFYSDAVLHPNLSAQVGTIDFRRDLGSRKAQFVLNSSQFLTKEWRPGSGGLPPGWVLTAGPLPVEQMAEAIRRQTGTAVPNR